MYDKYIAKYVQKKTKNRLTFQVFSKSFCSKSFLTSCFEWKVESAGFSLKLFHCVSRTYEELATNLLESPRSELQKLTRPQSSFESVLSRLLSAIILRVLQFSHKRRLGTSQLQKHHATITPPALNWTRFDHVQIPIAIDLNLCKVTWLRISQWESSLEQEQEKL